MSVPTAKATLRTRLETLIPTHVRKVLNGQPSSPQNLPLVYMELRDGERQKTASVTVNIYRIAVCAVVAFQDNVLAEDQIDALVNAVAAAIDDDMRYGQRTSGVGQDWNADFIEIGGVLTRRLTWIVRVKDEATNGSGL